jgi:hypothetical protein
MGEQGRTPSRAWARPPSRTRKPLTRRDLLRLGLFGAAPPFLSLLSSRCQGPANTKPPDDDGGDDGPEPVYRLTDGLALYDDFDGNGCLQTYDGLNLAEPGKLSTKIWQAWTGWGTADVVPDPSPLANPLPGRGNVLRLMSDQSTPMSCNCSWPTEIEFADVKSFGADILLSSQSTARQHLAWIDYHTTIPEQPPGKSWLVLFGVGNIIDSPLYIIAEVFNVNTTYQFFQYLEEASLDRWYTLRFDIVTRAVDPGLASDQFRVEFYLDGEFKTSVIPEDSALLLDPSRTGVGPKRIVNVATREKDRVSVAFFDNIRAVYKDRIG